MYYCRDHFWGPLSESRQFRGNIRRPVPKKHDIQCNPGIGGGVEQTNIEFQFFCVVFYIGNYVLLPPSLPRPLKGVQTPSRSIRRPVIKNHGFQLILELTAE